MSTDISNFAPFVDVKSNNGNELILAINVKRNTFSFRAVVAKAINEPEYVRVLLDPNVTHMALQGCNMNDAGSFEFRSYGNGYRRLSCKAMMDYISEKLNWNPTGEYRIMGDLDWENSLIMFDLKKAIDISVKASGGVLDG